MGKKEETKAKREEKDKIIVSTVGDAVKTYCSESPQLPGALSQKTDEELAADVSRIMKDMLSKKDKDTFCEAAAEDEEKMIKALVNAVKKGMSKEAKKEKMKAKKRRNGS